MGFGAEPIANEQKNNRRFIVIVTAALAAFAIWRLTIVDIDADAMRRQPASGEPAVLRYEAIGDSITYGEPLGFDVDADGYVRKASKAYQGWPGLLGQMLAEATGRHTEVFNKGYPGDRVNKVRVEWLAELFDREGRNSSVLLLIGTNDSNQFRPTPPGAGCTGDECEGTYLGDMRSLIRNLQRVGRDEIYIALLPPVWGSRIDEPYSDPLDFPEAVRNARIAAYNEVIADELLKLPGVRPGPDFFTCFLSRESNRFSLFTDTLHPNKMGYVFMAALWRDAILAGGGRLGAESCPSPIYLLEALDANAQGHKQNLLEVGDTYYNDGKHVLLNIPDELTDGIWVLQANADRKNTDREFLTFDVGEQPVGVYVGYDPAGAAPVSGTHDFVPVVLSDALAVSDPDVGELAIVRAPDVTGTVVLGGTRSGAAGGRPQAYVVVVVP